jgi:cardiolipin synthase
MSQPSTGGEQKVPRRRRPPQWRQINFPRRTIYRLNPNPRKRKGERALETMDRVRLFIRSSTVWVLLAALLFALEANIAGAVALVVAGVLLVFPAHIKDLSCHLDYDFGTDSAEFLSTLAGATGVPIIAGNRLAILNNGDQFYPSMLEAISKAEFSITMEQYIYSAGEIGRKAALVMAERARAGVKVKLLFDSVGATAIGKEILGILKEAGCEVAWFRPIRWYNLHRVNNRNHRKSVIIDGRIGFTGGAGFDDHWRGNASSPNEWRDLMIRMEGPGVAMLQTGFAFNWLETTGEVITGPRYYPVLDDCGSVELQTVLSSPKGDYLTASILYSLAILCARHCIYIANPYFIPAPQRIEMLSDASARGVDVKVMIAGGHNDNWWARQNSVRLYGNLLESGVEIYEYQPAMLHQKTMIVDSLWATVGTTNFDHRSFRLNEETNVCFYDPDLVEQLRDVFFADLQYCQKVDLAQWRRRGLMQRGAEQVASLLQDQV